MPKLLVTQAMILAAGLGKRLRPLTLTTPKPLIELGGTPLIQRALEALSVAEMETIVINTHYLGQQIETYISELSHKTQMPDLSLSPEPELLETGGGIAHALKYFKDGPLITVNSDIWWQDDSIFERMCAMWDNSKMDALLVVVRHENTFFFEGPGDFEMSPDSHLTMRGIAEKAEWIYTGIQLIHPRRLLKGRTGAFGLYECYKDAADEGRLYGLEIRGTWSDVGTLSALAGLGEILGCEKSSPEVQY